MAHEWKCGCGQWLPMSIYKHAHVNERAATVSELVEARKSGVDLTGNTQQIQWEPWTPQHERRVNHV